MSQRRSSRRGDARSRATNIADPAACAAIVAAATEEFGGVDVLVNNAFRFDAFQSFEEVDLDRWRKIMETNLFGSLQMTKQRCPPCERVEAGRW